MNADASHRFHEYLIEQVQHEQTNTAAASSELNFNHPVKELVFCVSATNGTLTTIGSWYSHIPT